MTPSIFLLRVDLENKPRTMRPAPVQTINDGQKMRGKKRQSYEGLLIVFGVSIFFACGAHLHDLTAFKPYLMLVGGLFGAYIGFAALPLFDAKYPERPILCSVIAALFALLAGYYFELAAPIILLLCAVCAALGYFAPKWVKHATF